MTTVVGFQNLPAGSESSFVWTVFDDDEKDSIKEIYTNPGGRGACAWVVFKTEEGAERAATKYDGHLFGPANQKMRTSLYSLFSIPASATNTLTKFLRDRDDQVETRTVKITNLPTNQTLRSLKSLFEATIEAFDCYEPDEDDPYHGSYEPNEILHLKSPHPGVGLVQLAKPSMAVKIIREFSGTYWKNATLKLQCVPDSEMQNLLAKPKATNGKTVQLFVSGIKPGTSSTAIQAMFNDYKLRDVNVPPGGRNFCFVFVYEDDANAMLSQYGPEFQFQGRTIRVSLAEKSKKKASRSLDAASTSSISTSAPSSPTTDLKVDNLPYGVGDATVRTLFEGFHVSKIVPKQGFAFVGVAANEAERAIQELNGRLVGEMNVSIKIATRRKD